MTSAARILVVEDGKAEREALARVLRLEGYEVVEAAGPQEAMRFIEEPIDLVVSDLRMGKQSGIDLLRAWQECHRHTPFLMLTAFADVESAVTAMKLGAADFLSKPVDPGELLELIRDQLDKVRYAPSARSDAAPAAGAAIAKIIGQSAAMQEVLDKTRLAAQTESIVLILGETGTGKELIAHAIHENSPRRDGPLVVVNMPAIPDTLVESELFGHLKGAFTGALADRVGRFEAAAGGTIFIDEIGDFPLHLQAKLLRVLENQTINPVGSNENRRVDARVVAATSRNLDQMMASGEFREDLYYRLHVVTIRLPPLRERREDIPLLAHHLVDELAQAAGRGPISLAPDLMQKLMSLDWPGNVRQLRNCLESMVAVTMSDVLTLDDLPARFVEREPAAASPKGPDIFGERLEEMQKRAMLRALERFNGNRTQAARYLGISVRTLQRKMKEWALTEAADEERS